jgi:two-component system, NarL family, sensor histidine kinase DesK
MMKNKWRNITIFPKKYGFFPYIYLLYVLFPVYYLMSETGLKQGVGFAMVCLFLVTYRQLYVLSGTSQFAGWLALQLAIVFIFSIFYHINYVFLGFFPANFIGWYLDKRKFKQGMVSLVFVVLTPFLYYYYQNNFDLSKIELLYLLPFIIIMFISPYGIRSMNKRMDLEKQLEKANEQIDELIKRDERVRIARDLHDTLGHTLSMLTLKSQLLQRLTAVDPERARLEAKEMETTSRAALKQVRELVSSMRSATLTEELLQTQQILKAANITYQYDGEVDFTAISPFIQNLLSMCLREATTNVVKHSHANTCLISINRTADNLQLLVKDDGLGLSAGQKDGNGLNGIRERLSLVDGTLLLSNHHGTVIELVIPIKQKAEKEGAAI